MVLAQHHPAGTLAPHEVHLVYYYPILEAPLGSYGFPMPDELTAQGMARILAENIDIVCDGCTECHPWQPRPHYPRFGLLEPNGYDYITSGEFGHIWP
jgi:hypothetical protein